MPALPGQHPLSAGSLLDSQVLSPHPKGSSSTAPVRLFLSVESRRGHWDVPAPRLRAVHPLPALHLSSPGPRQPVPMSSARTSLSAPAPRPGSWTLPGSTRARRSPQRCALRSSSVILPVPLPPGPGHRRRCIAVGLLSAPAPCCGNCPSHSHI